MGLGYELYQNNELIAAFLNWNQAENYRKYLARCSSITGNADKYELVSLENENGSERERTERDFDWDYDEER